MYKFGAQVIEKLLQARRSVNERAKEGIRETVMRIASIFLLFATSCANLEECLSEDANYTLTKYTSLIYQVHNYYRTSGAFILYGRSFNAFEYLDTLNALWKDLSSEGVLAASMDFTFLGKKIHYLYRSTSRPLFVVYIRHSRNLMEFVHLSSTIHMSYAVWLIIFSSNIDGNLCPDISKSGYSFALPLDVETLVLCEDEQIIWEWYYDDGRITLTTLASWSHGVFEMRANTSFYMRRSNLNGKQLQATLVNMNLVGHVPGTHIDKKIIPMLMNELQSIMNVALKLPNNESHFGNVDRATGNWTGAIAQLIHGDSEMGFGEFTMTTDRLEVIDFSLPFSLSKSKLYIKEPDKTVPWTGHFQAFSFGIWITILGIVLVVPILLTLIKFKNGTSFLYLLAENYLYVWGIYCQQGLSEFPTNTTVRLVLFSVFLSATIVSAAYSGSLTSYLAASGVVLPFTTMQGFIEDGSYKMIVFQASADYDLFVVREKETSKNTMARKMRSLLKPAHKLPTTVTQGFQEVCNEKVAFFVEDAIVDTINIYLPCKVVGIDSGFESSTGLILRKNSMYTRLLNFHIQRLLENGLLNRMRKRISTVSKQGRNILPEVELWGIALILALITGGMLLSSIILIFEIVIHNHQNGHIRRKHSRDLLFLKMQKRHAKMNSEGAKSTL
ncbi:glutamate receptor 1 isoform X2 [Cephus cinctus]|uniref:Glutamate receptor 1 isoform X2 n=1 Tax=Cephus cinctus TaxID=211228 RepID=A0AAJ7RGP9_CEPCN|nr:glutamate receptor 1 isoform X2 [Cephus cinctus]